MFSDMVRREVERARSKHPSPHASLHEGYAILLEEVDELWDEIKKQGPYRNRAAILAELIQVGAMCQRMAEDLGLV